MHEPLNPNYAVLQARREHLTSRYQAYQEQGLALDMTRGKPSVRQLNLANSMLEYPGMTDFRAEDGSDCRNYGGLDGLPEMKELFAEILEVAAENVIVGGNSSLTMMHDTLVRADLYGVPGGERPWRDEATIKFICPSPGYDRHFAITEHLGFELIMVDMNEDGPDMDQVESLVADDAAVKGIWCVPKYSNPTGATYSDKVVDRLAGMPTAAADFRIMWDNAYAEHHLTDEPPVLRAMLQACKKKGHEDRVYLFASTSKITFAGSGVAAMASSAANIAATKKHLAVQTIGPDKINQLRHLMFLHNVGGLRSHMQKHRELLKPKFDMVQEILQGELDGTDAAIWTRPQGGYFVSLDTPPGCATRVIQLAAEAGVKLTQAGAPFPYGKDPNDCNIRIAPSFPTRDEIQPAVEVLAVCIQLAVIEQADASS